MTYQEVLQRSKDMMDGQKWDAFVLDLSFHSVAYAWGHYLWTGRDFLRSAICESDRCSIV